MSNWEGKTKKPKTDEWYTPKYIFDALGCKFDTDVAAPEDKRFVHTPTKYFITKNSKGDDRSWCGMVWCNPPFSGRSGKSWWLNEMYEYGNGIALTPDRTSAPWWPIAAKQCDALMFVTGKIKFIQPDGTTANSPGNGTTLFAYGARAVEALYTAQERGLGIVMIYSQIISEP